MNKEEMAKEISEKLSTLKDHVDSLIAKLRHDAALIDWTLSGYRLQK